MCVDIHFAKLSDPKEVVIAIITLAVDGWWNRGFWCEVALCVCRGREQTRTASTSPKRCVGSWDLKWARKKKASVFSHFHPDTVLSCAPDPGIKVALRSATDESPLKTFNLPSQNVKGRFHPYNMGIYGQPRLRSTQKCARHCNPRPQGRTRRPFKPGLAV